MRVMGFSIDPGPLPFTTVRGEKWACRLTVGDLVQVRGEHGCTLPKQAARVVSIVEGVSMPPELADHYGGQRCCAVSLVAVPADDPELARSSWPV
jgi:hypothetical protein